MPIMEFLLNADKATMVNIAWGLCILIVGLAVIMMLGGRRKR